MGTIGRYGVDQTKQALSYDPATKAVLNSAAHTVGYVTNLVTPDPVLKFIEKQYKFVLGHFPTENERFIIESCGGILLPEVGGLGLKIAVIPVKSGTKSLLKTLKPSIIETATNEISITKLSQSEVKTTLQKVIEDNTGVTRGKQSFPNLTKKELDLLPHENIIIDNPHGTISIKLQSGKELIQPYKEINTNLHTQNINQLKHYSNEMIRGLTREEVITNITNLELKKLIEELYKPGAKIGSGSSAAAHLQETFTGKKVGNRFHAQKVENYSTKLQRWLGNNSEEALLKKWDRVKTVDSADNLKEFLINSNVSAADRQIAKYLLDDMLNSLNDAKKLKIMKNSLK
ncbi:MAG: hypothetical protein ACIPMY_06220 [Rickettsia endosymbiont of Pentastiridius leporinus]